MEFSIYKNISLRLVAVTETSVTITTLFFMTKLLNLKTNPNK